jgi:tetratricopeptide (TPR) repeat protein
LKSAAAIFFLLLASHAVGQITQAAADDAYQTGLWDVAARQYEAILAGEEIADEKRAALALRLAECRVREGSPAAALAMLEQGLPAATQPAAAFWRGQALAGLGRFAEAVAAFEAHLAIADVPHRLEAALTCANLQLSLDLASGALQTLAAFAATAGPDDAVRANLQRAAILIDSGYPEDARPMVPAESSVPIEHMPMARYLLARLKLADGAAEDAAGLFAALLGDPTGQTIAIHHGAAIGLADAIHTASGPEAALRSLLTFLASQPDTPMLDAAFQRILLWLPEKPASADPTLAKLAEWIPQPTLPSTGFIPAGEGAATAWPTNPDYPDIAAFAMFARATGLHRADSPAADDEARHLMARLRATFPDHFLAHRSHLVESRWLLAAGNLEGALYRLSIAAETSRSVTARGQALFFEAYARAKAGEGEAAATLFEEAAQLLDNEFSEAARFNAALARLRENPDAAPAADAPEITGDLRIRLALERALAKPDPAAAVAALDGFLRDHPTHPRAPEARLAAAERAMRLDPPDLSFTRAQLETLDALPALDGIADAANRLALALVRLRLADRQAAESGAPDAAIDLARRILANSPTGPLASEAALTLGRNLFQSGNFNDARIAFERLAITNLEIPDADPALTQAAFLLAARAAALGATAQSRDEALALFDRASAIQGAPLRGIATLEKARLLIDLNRPQPAIAALTAARDEMDPADPLHIPAGLLLGEAIYAKGTSDTGSLEAALAIYDELLARATAAPDMPAALFHRLQYLRGITLEKLPRPDAPHLKRDAEAIEAYFSVIQRAGDAAPAEWEWFERCAFGALALLEKAERWQAAIHLARRIAAFNGPRAADAAERATQLQLKHMIWED